MANRSRVRWSRIAEAMLLGAITTPALADEAAPAALTVEALGRPAPPDPAADVPLMLAVTLNRMPRPDLLPFVLRSGRLYATPATLRAIGFTQVASTAAPLPLDAIPGVQVRYEGAAQRVAIDAPLSQLALDTARIGRPLDVVTVAADSSPGALLNYDLYGSRASDGRQLGAATELRVFGVGPGVWSTTALTRAVQARDPQGRPQRLHEALRLDTRWDVAFPDAAVTFTLGDTIGGFLEWTRPVRLGGVRIGRDFALQPYRIVTPTPAFLGEVSVPSTVELYVDGLRQYQGQVPTGPFELTTVPGISGAGNARVVITDGLGRTRTLEFPFYATQRLLAAGLSDWSISAGRVREDYGVRSASYYPDLVGTGSLRLGVSDRLTLELHAEGGAGLGTGGAGAAWLMGMAGVANASHVYSRFDGLAGSQTALGYSWQPGRLNLAFDRRTTRGDYRDIASLYGPLPPRRSARGLLGWSDSRAGNFSLSYLRLDRAEPGIAPARYAGAFWSRSFRQGWSASISVNQNLDDRADRTAYVGVLVPLGRDRQLSVAAQRYAGGEDLLVDVARPVPGDGGTGWRVQARAGGQAGGLAEAGWLHAHGRLLAGARQAGDQRQVYAQADGALVWMGGGLFASRRIDDAFAVVATDGLADVPVRLENREVGRTGPDGRLLVTPLRAWQENRVGIDPMHLPPNIRIDQVAQRTTPSDRAGSTVRFRLRRVRAALLVLHDHAGMPLPVGAEVIGAPDAGGGAIVGHGGETYLEGLVDDDNRIRVRHGADTCLATFRLPPASATIPRIGPLPCRPETGP